MEFLISVYFATGCLIIATYFCYIKRLRSKYPPGPWPLPIIGNLHLLSKNRHIALMNLSKTYGPVYTMWLGSSPTVIVCNKEGIDDVLYRKGVEFAGRPMSTLALKILFYENEDLVSRSYDDKVKICRKLGMSIMREKSSGGLCLEKIVEEEVEYLLTNIRNLAGGDVDAYHIVKVPIANTIMRSIFNFRFENEHDPGFLEYTEHRLQRSAATAKALMVEVFRPLWYLLPSIRREIYESTANYKSFIERYIKQHEDTYEKGKIRDFTDAVITYQREQSNEVPASQRLTKLNVFGLVSNMVAGGTHTTTIAVLWCFLVLLHYPTIQGKIHQELLKRLSKRFSPAGFKKQLSFDLDDRPHLPYLNAFIHETLRRCTLSPLGAPHRSMVETSIGAYAIPKDTSVICNVYACLMNDVEWTEPYQIIPERFLDASGEFDRSKAKRVMAFGAGPRSCIGEVLARKELFICLSNVLYLFEICPSSTQDFPSLNDVVLSLECCPMPFKVNFKLRNV